jgi:F-type H+-transporting ATPase subunit b
MRRLAAMAALILVASAGLLAAQEHESEAAKEAGENPTAGEHGKLEAWKWVNFLILAGGLGWLAKKNAGPFFASRSRQIRKQMVEADEVRAEAERRSAEVDRKLANLKAEIEGLHREAQAEAESEGRRYQEETAADLAKIEAHAQQEIAAAGKQARLELRRYSAELALGLAGQKIRARMTPGTQAALVQKFVKDLEPASRAQTS